MCTMTNRDDPHEMRQNAAFYQGLHYTLENLCTRTAQSSRGGHSRRVEKLRVYVHLAVIEGNKFLNILHLRVFFADYCH